MKEHIGGIYDFIISKQKSSANAAGDMQSIDTLLHNQHTQKRNNPPRLPSTSRQPRNCHTWNARNNKRSYARRKRRWKKRNGKYLK